MNKVNPFVQIPFHGPDHNVQTHSEKVTERALTYRFFLHLHPYVERLEQELNSGSLARLQGADTEFRRDVYDKPIIPTKKPIGANYQYYQEIFTPINPEDQESLTKNPYLPLAPEARNEDRKGVFVDIPYSVRDLDFDYKGAYSVYNWELFFHAPLSIAIHLSRNQRFEEAQKWFHYVFDPTDDSEGPTPERFWKVKPFQTTDVKLIEEILVNLVEGSDEDILKKTTRDCISAWQKAPFKPHVIARYRSTAYMFKTVCAYLDNLISWGDSLFFQGTGESINEATQIYVLAANILGTKPQVVPKKGSVKPKTYDELREYLKDFGGVVVDLENSVAEDGFTPSGEGSENGNPVTLRSLGQTLYFCVPPNDKMLGYWDTVADRLFKIHNSLNIQGIFRQLPLFEPPIDPALLAKAATAGLDIGAVINGLNQPLPMVRFQFFIQKAMEICQEVKSLGNSALSAMEKEDNEAFSLLRARHESAILELTKAVKYAQWQEAIKVREGFLQSLSNAVERYTFYERQLGKEGSDITIPAVEELDKQGLMKYFRMAVSEPAIVPRPIAVDIAKDAGDSAGGSIVSSCEKEELKQLDNAHRLKHASSVVATTGAFLGLIPQFQAKASPIGVGVATGFGGVQISGLVKALASVLEILADDASYQANMSAKLGGYARREQEWQFQSNLAAGEITQIFKQLTAAQIREAIAEREWQNHKQQIQHACEIENFLKGNETPIGEGSHKKASTQALYAWMKREVKGLYAQCFQFAFDIAKKAERALQHELGNPDLSYLQFGYLEGKEGLLAGEKLYLDLKRMEMAYHELN